MAIPLTYLQWLSDLFDEAVEHLSEAPSLEERTQLLRHWKILKSIEQRVREELLGLNEDSSTYSPEHSGPNHNPTNRNVTLR